MRKNYTVGGVDIDGRYIRRNEHEQETTDQVRDSKNENDPPERHFSE